MSDSLVSGRKFRSLIVMDDCSREALDIEIDTSLSSKRVIRVLERVIQQRSKPQVIRVDNDPEYTSKDFKIWVKGQQIRIQYIQSGCPCRMAILNDLTAVTEEMYWMPMSFLSSMRYGG
jgi:putative transposase